jgi:hypothetical protein
LSAVGQKWRIENGHEDRENRTGLQLQLHEGQLPLQPMRVQGLQLLISLFGRGAGLPAPPCVR